MKQALIFAFILSSISGFGQTPEYYRVNKDVKDVTLTPQDNNSIVLYRISGLFDSTKNVSYVDSANSFRVAVPTWLYLRESTSLNYFGGTLPAINKIENAIVISSTKKNEFETLSAFKNIIIEDSSYKKGVSPKWASDRTFISIQHDTLGNKKFPSYKVAIERKGNVFICNYVLLETKTAYLWIQFTATEETYSVNIVKFVEFLQGLNLLS